MTAFPEKGFEILNNKQLEFVFSLLRSCITNDSLYSTYTERRSASETAIEFSLLSY